MSTRSIDASDPPVGFFSILFLVFLVLKLTEIIAWSWWWVTAPLWGPLALIGIIAIPVVLIAAWKR